MRGDLVLKSPSEEYEVSVAADTYIRLCECQYEMRCEERKYRYSPGQPGIQRVDCCCLARYTQIEARRPVADIIAWTLASSSAGYSSLYRISSGQDGNGSQLAYPVIVVLRFDQIRRNLRLLTTFQYRGLIWISPQPSFLRRWQLTSSLLATRPVISLLLSTALFKFTVCSQLLRFATSVEVGREMKSLSSIAPPSGLVMFRTMSPTGSTAMVERLMVSNESASKGEGLGRVSGEVVLSFSGNRSPVCPVSTSMALLPTSLDSCRTFSISAIRTSSWSESCNSGIKARSRDTKASIAGWRRYFGISWLLA